MLQKVKKFFEGAGIVIGGFLAIAALITYFGIQITTPSGAVGEKLNAHVEKSDEVHMMIRAEKDSSEQHVEHVEELVKTMNEDMNTMLIPLIRTSCLDRSREQLAMLGMLQKCQSMGIVPSPPTAAAQPAPARTVPDSVPQ